MRIKSDYHGATLILTQKESSRLLPKQRSDAVSQHDNALALLKVVGAQLNQ